jgi:hypothetical protein
VGDERDGGGVKRVAAGGEERGARERLTAWDTVARRRIAPVRARSIHFQVERVLLLFDAAD